MSNPVLVEVTRGSVVESRHRGAVSVFDADGNVVLDIGDTTRPVFARSAIKAVQALPFVESGAVDAFGFGNEEIAETARDQISNLSYTHLFASRSHESAIELAEKIKELSGVNPT